MFEPKKVGRREAGLPPGTLEYVGPEKAFRPTAELVRYSEEGVTVTDVTRGRPKPGPGGAAWMRVRGLHDEELIKRVGETFSLSPMLLEDVLNTGQRPKLEEHEDCLFVVLKALEYAPSPTGGDEVRHEQVCLVLGEDWVISFCEAESDPFEAVSQRLAKGRGKLRVPRADYLFLTLLDTVIDHVSLALGRLGEEIETLEEQLMDEDMRTDLTTIYRLRRAVLSLGRAVWPLRELMAGLRKPDLGFVGEDRQAYIRDIYDHGMQAAETLEHFRESLTAMQEVVVSSLTMRTNEVMKVLTTVATIFIPLTFITGVYGMNFKHMPELGWRWGYFGALGLMALVAGGLVLYFKRKDWF